MKTAFSFVFLCLFLVSCESYDLNHKGFEPITEKMLSDSITPAFHQDYFEVREFSCWDTTNYQIKFSKGSYPLTDSLFCSQGVNFSSAGWCVFFSVLSFNGSIPTFWTTYDDIVYFLAPIDTYSDALLLARLKGYSFKLNDEGLGIKKENGKFYLKVLKLVRTCDPIETDQFFLEIDEAGSVKVMDHKVYEVLKGACI